MDDWVRRKQEKTLKEVQRRKALRSNPGPCPVPGCGKRRWDGHRHCQQHSKRLRLYGSVNGFAGRKSDLNYHREQAARILQAHEGKHEGLKAALNLLDGWFTAAARPDQPTDRYRPRIAGKKLVDRLVKHGVEPWECLIEMTAAFMYAMETGTHNEQPGELAYYVAHCMARLAPKRRATEQAQPLPPEATEVKQVARYLAETFFRFFTNVYAAHLEANRKHREQIEALDMPLEPVSLEDEDGVEAT